MRKPILAVIAGAVIALATEVAADPVTEVFVIGDSLNDTGTFAPVTATGRFTTTPGLIWTEIVAAAHGAAVPPAFFFDGERLIRNKGGTNYAQSGALVTGDRGLFNEVSKPVVWQVDQLLDHQHGDLDGSLVLMDGGGPDVVLAAVLTQEGKLTPEHAIAQVETTARDLARQAQRVQQAGPESLVLLGVANFGTTPMFGSGEGETATYLQTLSQAFNAAVIDEAEKLQLDAVLPDIYAFFNDVIAQPDEHGLVNVVEPGVHPERSPATPTGNSANSNPSHLVQPDAARTYLFADGVHPSGRGHELLAGFVLDTLNADKQR